MHALLQSVSPTQPTTIQMIRPTRSDDSKLKNCQATANFFVRSLAYCRKDLALLFRIGVVELQSLNHESLVSLVEDYVWNDRLEKDWSRDGAADKNKSRVFY
jgi:hypothetical protein